MHKANDIICTEVSDSHECAITSITISWTMLFWELKAFPNWGMFLIDEILMCQMICNRRRRHAEVAMRLMREMQRLCIRLSPKKIWDITIKLLTQENGSVVRFELYCSWECNYIDPSFVHPTDLLYLKGNIRMYNPSWVVRLVLDGVMDCIE